MKFGIYGQPNPHLDKPLLWSFAQGAEKRGHRVIWRNPAPFTPEQVEDFDAVVVLGMQPRKRLVVEAYNRAGRPAVVVDLGYLKREEYFQVGLNGLNWLPPFDCPDDRFRALGISRASRPRSTKKKPGVHIVIAGQKPGDGQHRMADNQAVITWAQGVVDRIREITDRPIIWRPHPLAPVQPVRFAELSDPRERTLARDLDGAHALVTFNSNAGHEALLAGIPVFCDPSAMYAEVANTDLSLIETPRWQSTKDYFSRLAYAQWTLDEMACGECMAFLETLLEDWKPPDEGA